MRVPDVADLPVWYYDRYLCLLRGKNKAEADSMESAQNQAGSGSKGTSHARDRARAFAAYLAEHEAGGDEDD